MTSHRLGQYYFKPHLVAGNLEKILRGMVGQKSQELDLNYDDDVSYLALFINLDKF